MYRYREAEAGPFCLRWDVEIYEDGRCTRLLVLDSGNRALHVSGGVLCLVTASALPWSLLPEAVPTTALEQALPLRGLWLRAFLLALAVPFSLALLATAALCFTQENLRRRLPVEESCVRK
jgi:hypothetical protein